jgi:hypothetical protein
MKKHLTFSLALLTLICTSANAQLPSYLPADGLVGWWPFNGNANDESGNGNDGVVNGAVLASDRNGVVAGAYVFNGINSWIDVGNTFFDNGWQSYTINVWVMTSSLSGLNQMIVNSNPHDGFAIGISSAEEMFVAAINSNPSMHVWDIINPSQPNSRFNYSNLVVNNWYQVTLVKESNVYRYYVNGVLDKTVNTSISPVSYQMGIRLGQISPGWSPEPFNGSLDDIAIHNRALTPQEIQNLYTGTTPAACLDLPANLQDGLVGYWPFCGNANDESGNGNNGTVNGATLAEDRFGNAGSAYSFDGVDDFIQSNANSIPAFSDHTVSFYAKLNTLDVFGDGIELICLGNSSSTSWGVLLASNGACFKNFGRGCQGQGGAALSQVFSGNSWDFYSLSTDFNSEITQIFKNGNLVGEIPIASVFGNCASGNLFFGVDIFSQPEFFSGLLDDITIYNRALSPEEVTQLYAVQSTGDPTAGGGGNTTGPLANVPRGISYQAVARDAQGQAIASSPVNVRFTLHQGTPIGTTEYSETHALTTNDIGLFHTFFGAGTAITSAFDSIVWSNTTKFLQVEIDLGNGYVDMGTQQLMSVPYAYRANEAAAAGTIRNNTLPIYPDNAAALAVGLVAGEMYRTATGDLKVVY